MDKISANCPECYKREEFELIEKNKYKCISCSNIMHKCKSKNCNNMIKHGLFCSKCIGDGFKKGGSLTVGLLAVGVATGAKIFLNGKGTKKI